MNDFETVYRMYFSEVTAYLRALCRDEVLAEELTEQTFFQALRALPKFRGECDIRTWLCSIGKNCYRNHLRKQGRIELSEQEPTSDTVKSPEEEVLQKDSTLAIHRALHSLPEPYREVFSLRVFGELSFSDIGAIFGKNQNWACVTYHRARQKIKELLEDRNEWK